MKQLISIFIFSVLCTQFSAAQNITTIAGSNFNGDSVNKFIGHIKPYGVAADAAGNIYLSDRSNHVVRMVNASTGIIKTIAGTGIPGFSGDGGPATAAQMEEPGGITIDGSGNVYFVDGNNYRIRKITPTGIITTIAGTGTAGYTGDGVPATTTQIAGGTIVSDAAGVIYIGDGSNYRIRKIALSGIISTIAGTGSIGYTGDGGPATAADISVPSGISLVPDGSVIFSDLSYHIRKINTSGVISTIAGDGTWIGTPTDGTPATSGPVVVGGLSLASDAIGNIYLQHDHAICKINTSGIVTRIAGNYSTGGATGDGGPAISAIFDGIVGVATDPSNNVYIAALGEYAVRMINTSGIINTVAGNHFPAYTGDGGKALKAIMRPMAFSLDASGRPYFFDNLHAIVRHLEPNGDVTWIAGKGEGMYPTGDGGPAKKASLSNVCDITVDKNDNVYIVDAVAHNVRKVNTSGIMSTFTTLIADPTSAMTDTALNLFVTDANSRKVYKVTPGGSVSLFAGTGVSLYAGDGGPAAAASFNWPTSITMDRKGNIYISDSARIRKINAAGIISTYAGNGTAGYSGDGGAATLAQIYPSDLKTDSIGNLYLGDGLANVIRKIDTFGTISTIAGTGAIGYSGDGGPALSATFNNAGCIGVDKIGNVYVGEFYNQRIRFICNSDTLSPSVTVTVTEDTVTEGVSVTFTATAVNCGATPQYQWQKNTVNIAGATSSTYTTSTLSSGDVITSVVTNPVPMPCVSAATATGNNITMTILPLGIWQIKNDQEFAVYPNPNVGDFTIKGQTKDDSIDIELLDITGKLIERKSAGVVAGQFDVQISASHLAPGFYSVRVVSSSGVRIQKMMVQNK